MIDKWLKAGVLEDGLLRHATEGSPQGGVISPCLSNVFPHHVLDEWFENELKPRLRGASTLVRFADDAVMSFAEIQDAMRVLDVLGKRLARYELTLHPDKTRFARWHDQRNQQRCLDLSRSQKEARRLSDWWWQAAERRLLPHGAAQGAGRAVQLPRAVCRHGHGLW